MTQTMVWKVDWFESRDKKFVRSKTFCVATGFQFFFGLWPNGEKNNAGSLGVYLFFHGMFFSVVSFFLFLLIIFFRPPKRKRMCEYRFFCLAAKLSVRADESLLVLQFHHVPPH